jgi:hypothetical protein
VRAEHSETDGAAPPRTRSRALSAAAWAAIMIASPASRYSQRTFILSHFTTRLDGLDKKTQGGRGDAALR